MDHRSMNTVLYRQSVNEDTLPSPSSEGAYHLLHPSLHQAQAMAPYQWSALLQVSHLLSKSTTLPLTL